MLEFMKIDKNYIIIALLILLIAFGAFYGIEKNEYLTARELEAKRERTQLKNLRDSLKTVIKRKDAELLKAFMEVSEADMLAREAEIKADKAWKEYEKIRYVRFANDTLRSNAIAELYPAISRP